MLKLFAHSGIIWAFLITLAPAVYGAQVQSQWVYFDPHGRLVYRALPKGDHIMDFSYAGYGGGGVAIPDVPVKITVNPGGDDARQIQAAIDQVSQLNLVDGHRGTVLLSSGTFNCDQPLTVKASGIVLRGSDGTVLNLTGTPHLAINVSGERKTVTEGQRTVITDDYVSSGSDSFVVASAAGWQVGDTIQIARPVTSAWVSFMGMNTLVRDGKAEHWLSGTLETERVISQISGNRITVSVPLSDDYDSRYLKPPGSTAVKVKISGLISEVGIEHLRILSPPQPIEITQPQFKALQFTDAQDCWARDLDIHDTIGSVHVGEGASRITIARVTITHSVATQGAALQSDFGASGTRALFDHCSSTGNHLFYFATFGRTQGPNVLLNCVFHGEGHVQPHMRWSTGLLVDGCQAPTGGIDLMNRGIMGSGHGWTMGWGVAWNCQAKSYVIQQPPGATNWAIGCRGTFELEGMPPVKDPKLPSGIIDSPNSPVAPQSLYLEQLRERLGDEAVKNIGY
jgi:hypothetical protein